MRRWLSIAAAAAASVGDRPATWLPGALAWLCTIGWIPLVVGVARVPTVSDLTFLGSRIFGSALWPWNLALPALGLAAVVATAFVLAAAAESALLDELGGPRRGLRLTWPLLAIAAIAAIPAAAALLLLAVQLRDVAPIEFSAPDRGTGPVVRTLGRLLPFLVLFAVAAAAGSVLQAAAARLVHDRAEDVRGALAGSARLLVSGGAPVLAQLVASALGRLATIVVGAVLLRVLWAPVGVLLAGGERGALTIGLLVGFVAIWLCLVLVAGALHAWASAGWSLLLTGRLGEQGLDRRRQEASIDR